MEAYQNAALSPEERAKDLLGKMTLQEKVGQLNQRLYGFRIYERQGEEFTLTEEFKETQKLIQNIEEEIISRQNAVKGYELRLTSKKEPII